MQIRNSIYRSFLLITLLTLSATNLSAQSGDALDNFSSYSLFGVGNLSNEGTAYNMGMGGIGIGVRDNRFINITNPASLTARDTLSFYLDFGTFQNNFYSRSNNSHSAFNTFNMNNLVLSFPLYKKSAFAIGIVPYSSIGYDFTTIENDPEMILEYGDLYYQKYGNGGVSKLFLGTSMILFKNLSIGAEGIFYFGTLNRNSDLYFSSSDQYRSIRTGKQYVVRAVTAKLGAQYSRRIGKEHIFTLGATWRAAQNFSGNSLSYAYTNSPSGTVDTVFHNVVDSSPLSTPSQIGAGLSFRKRDKWLIGLDYIREDWSNIPVVATPGVNFATSLRRVVKAGFEYVPNRYDIRYYHKRIAYRGGLYYENSYMKIDDNQINAMGLTFGATLPIFRLYNGMGIAIDIGRKGSVKNNLVREGYVLINLNFSLHDIWFLKFRYD